jgi:hypothetical protein
MNGFECDDCLSVYMFCNGCKKIFKNRQKIFCYDNGREHNAHFCSIKCQTKYFSDLTKITKVRIVKESELTDHEKEVIQEIRKKV